MVVTIHFHCQLSKPLMVLTIIIASDDFGNITAAGVIILSICISYKNTVPLFYFDWAKRISSERLI